jgi:hypothetical protein
MSFPSISQYFLLLRLLARLSPVVSGFAFGLVAASI